MSTLKERPLNAQELSTILNEQLKCNLTKEDQIALADFFKAKYRRDEITIERFKQLTEMQFKRIYKKNEALRSIKKIKRKLKESGRSLEDILLQ